MQLFRLHFHELKDEKSIWQLVLLIRHLVAVGKAIEVDASSRVSKRGHLVGRKVDEWTTKPASQSNRTEWTPPVGNEQQGRHGVSRQRPDKTTSPKQCGFGITAHIWTYLNQRSEMALNAIIHRDRPSWFQEFQQAPYTTLARSLYARRQRILLPPRMAFDEDRTTVVCVSDTHNSQPTLPPGDILIHAGDLTQGGTAEELQAQLDWLDAQPHQHKVVIAGNHDIILDGKKSAELDMPGAARESLRWGSLIYLEHSTTSLRIPNGKNMKLFGHPSTRKHGNWAFQYEKGIDAFTGQVPDDVDILITHSAPRFHLDVAGWGDENLLRQLWRVRPRLHVFGHIHGGYGQEYLVYDRFEALFEEVCRGHAGIFALLHMLVLLIQAWLFGCKLQPQRTILVNASAVGGRVDEEVRKPVIVSL